MSNKNFPFMPPFNVLWRDMNDLRHDVERFVGQINPTTPTQQPTNTTCPTKVAKAAPAINVWEDDANFYAELDLPAIVLEKLDVTITEGNHLTIQGERQTREPANAVWHRQERFSGTFLREVTLPLPVNADGVQANYEQGVLKLVLPKSEAVKPRKIAVRSE